VPFGRVGADDHDAIGVFEVLDGVGGGAGAEGALHPDGGRGVAYPGATVNIVGADDRADELLHQVVFLVGATRRRNAGNGVRAVSP
jgi:hypothetical protein